MIVLRKMAEDLRQLVEDSCDPDFTGSPSKMRRLRAAADGLASVTLGMIEDGKTAPQVIRTVGELDSRIKLTNIQDGYAEVSLRESANPNQYERSCFVFVHRVFIRSETIVRKDGTTWETPEVDGWAQGLTGCPNSIAGNIYPTRAMAANSVIDQLLRMERKIYANE